MALGCVADAVDTLYDGVHCCVVADGRICAIKVVVDSTRQADAANIIFLGEFHSTCQRTVTADNNQSVNAMGLDLLVSLLLALIGHELLGACCLEDSTARHNNAADILCCEVLNLAINKSIVTTIDSFYIKSIANTCTSHGTNCSIHSRGVATRSQDSNCLNFNHTIFCIFLIIKIFRLSVWGIKPAATGTPGLPRMPRARPNPH